MRTALTKIARIIPIMLLVSLGTSVLLEFVPGDPVIAVLGETVTPERYERVEAELGLDRPTTERYVSWLSGAVKGDFGNSLLPPTESVADMIRSRLPVTIEIALLAVVLSLVFAVPAGIWAAYRAGTPIDSMLSGSAFAAISVPSFLSAIVLVFLAVFNRGALKALIVLVGVVIAVAVLASTVLRARSRGWRRSDTLATTGAVVLAAVAVGVAIFLPEFPRQGFSRLTDSAGLMENLRTAFLPALTLAFIEGAVFMRVLRADMATTLQEDYILAARAKGMSTRHVLLRDALRPSMFSLITVAGVSLGRLLGGTVIVEAIFRLPGMGTMLVQAIEQKNFTVVQGSVVTLAFLYVLVNTVVDLSYSALDPRLRHDRT